MNEYERLRRYAESLREQYPAGTRIMVNSMYDDPRPLPLVQEEQFPVWMTWVQFMLIGTMAEHLDWFQKIAIES